MQSLPCATDTAQINATRFWGGAPTLDGDVPHRWGFEDGLEGVDIFVGYSFFAGVNLQVYFNSHAEGVAMRLWLEGVVLTEVERMSEEQAMDATLADLRSCRMQPIVRLSPEDLYEIENERIGA